MRVFLEKVFSVEPAVRVYNGDLRQLRDIMEGVS
jgi:hypothetical protein